MIQKTEVEIMQNWKGDISNPLVSICSITYNHEEFIAEALDSFLMQETDFPFEIIIGEDYSTDDTRKIIQEYVNKYPNIIKLIISEYNVGMLENSRRTIVACSGEYIAFCEGDDYWTDVEKLQRQVIFLENNPKFVATTENTLVINTYCNTEYLFGSETEQNISIEKLLENRLFATSSVLARTYAVKESTKHFKATGDIGIWCYLVSVGKVHYTPYVSSVYRRGEHGVVLGTGLLKWSLLMEKWNEELESFLSDRIDKSIFKKRNFSQFFSVFKSGILSRNIHFLWVGGYKSFLYSPSLFIRKTSSLFIKVFSKILGLEGRK